MILYGYNKIGSLCAACKYSSPSEDFCMRFTVKVKLEKRKLCGDFAIKEDSLLFINEHPVFVLVNSACRLRKNWGEEWDKRVKWQKLAKERWHEVKKLKQRINELEKP